ncbi:SUMO-specific isopeptidase USPL1 [Oryzias latipes]|uniref:Ubiquitin specific peptidase like 1 n=1 Tax=Oryzias latipes TaxID=8090 RepID=H2LE66_ORYLA|nr:SUMO-specific isopeptidase USPL1 [Oryzias latipes]
MKRCTWSRLSGNLGAEPSCCDMVMFSEQHLVAVEPKRSDCLPMTDGDTGLEALASPQAGYLGKVQERAASLDHCPWCAAKGLTFSLRSYHINLQESITLCTNSQCLFPLVTRPLEDILSGLDLTKSIVENKRKNNFALEHEELVKSPVKRQRISEDADFEPQSGTQTDRDVISPIRNGLQQTLEDDGKNLNENQKVSVDAETVGCNYSPDKDVQKRSIICSDDCAASACLASEELSSNSLGATVENEATIPSHLGSVDTPDKTSHHRISIPDNDQDTLFMEVDIPLTPALRTDENSPTADIIICKDGKNSKPGSEDLSCTSQKSSKLVSVPKQLFWSNRDSLCWLDSLLVALVNCKSLRKSKPKEEPQRSSVWHLMTKYDSICSSIKTHQHTDKDGLALVPSHVLQQANADLESLRISLFQELQPKLHCKLGQRETPVFAMPLLLKMDSWAEPLFQLTFRWEFQCRECKVASKERVTKTLPTFTKVVSDWHPQHAVHFSPCNYCRRPNQMRTMTLERVPEVFALHFVEGLPQNDVNLHSFNFNEKRYSITTVIRYDQQLQHFVTWTRRSDGSWLEYDDLKHPECQIHQELLIPAHEMHIIFWEEEGEEPSVCSPSSTFVEPPPPVESLPSLTNLSVNEPLLHNDTDIISAFVEEESPSAANADTSIGATTLLDAFQGLNHNDIVTLTLVELETHQETLPSKDNKPAQDFNVSSRDEKFPSSPDSSSPTEVNVCQSSKPPATASSSGPESDVGIDPTFVTATASSEPSTPVPNNSGSPIVHDNQKASPVSSTDTSALSTNQESSTTTSVLGQNARLSLMLTAHPLYKHKWNKNLEVTQELTPAAKTRLAQPLHSTPHPLKKQPIPITLSKPQILADESGEFPPKAAEMYGGFSTKSLPPSPALPNDEAIVFQTVSKLPSMPTSKQFLDIWPSKKLPSKVPPGLSDTEALRYKLIKKLKAKKKKLAKLNQQLGKQGGTFLLPDSTALTSPSTVSSSTYDGSTCDDFLSELLSPATTASNVSPDSTGFLEMLASGQNVPETLNSKVSDNIQSHTNCGTNEPDAENFLEMFLSQCC